MPLQSSMACHTIIKKTDELYNNFNTNFLFAFINTVTMKNITINKHNLIINIIYTASLYNRISLDFVLRCMCV